MTSKVWYSKKKVVDGVLSIRHYTELFKDEDTGELFPVKRQRPIRLNGEKIVMVGKIPKGRKPIDLRPIYNKEKIAKAAGN